LSGRVLKAIEYSESVKSMPSVHVSLGNVLFMSLCTAIGGCLDSVG